MKKETIVAISFGILLGVGVGFFVLFQTGKNEETKVIPVEPDKKKVITTKTESTTQTQLTLTAPESGSIIRTKTVEIKGSAMKNALIVIQSPTGEIMKKSESGDFAEKFPLSIGENVIQISAYSESSTPQEKTLRVFYIPEE